LVRFRGSLRQTGLRRILPHHQRLILLTGLLISLLGSGCLKLKPVEDPVRYFLLTPVEPHRTPATDPSATSTPIAVGIEHVELPAYLSRPWLVVRTSPTEIRYSDYWKWGEHLDQGIQRVVAENLARHLGPAGNVYLHPWRKHSVAVELRLTVRQFDVDEHGQVQLEAQWQWEGSRTGSGQRVIRRSGPAPHTDPAGAVASLSEALGELSRLLAGELQP
jgi:uncharacterized lipoprotein YmbA